MKKFTIPLVNMHFTIYEGDAEWGNWYDACKREGCIDFNGDTREPPDGGGRCWYGWLWVKSKKLKNTVYHEVAHMLHRLFENTNCEKEDEFRAYLSGAVLEKIHNWIEGK